MHLNIEDAGNNPHTDNQSLELFRFQRAIYIALAEKIIEVLENPNSNLTPDEKAYWFETANNVHELSVWNNEIVKKLIILLGNQVKAENSWLN